MSKWCRRWSPPGTKWSGSTLASTTSATSSAHPTTSRSCGVDLRDVEADHLDGFDAVAHLGALSNDPLGNVNANLTYDINLHASVRLAEAAKQAGVERFLFASSCSLYGAGGDGLLDESSEFNPVTPYGESKVLVEQAVTKLADDSFSPVYLRNATAYGVSRRLRADIVVNDLVGHAVTTGKVLLQSDGSPWRPLVHIGDIISAFAACLVAPRDAIHDQAFNVGMNGENYQIRDVANLVAEVVPDCAVAFAGGASPDTRNYKVDFSKIERQVPEFTPKWTLRMGSRSCTRRTPRLASPPTTGRAIASIDCARSCRSSIVACSTTICATRRARRSCRDGRLIQDTTILRA